VITAAQVTLSFTLIVVGALLGQTLMRLTEVDLGFNPDGVLTMRLEMQGGRFTGVAQRAQFHDALLSRVRSLPGIQKAAMISFLPLTDPGGVLFSVEGHAEMADQSRLPTARLWVVTPEYFEAMGIRIVAGRTFENTDRTQGAPPVVVVNRALAGKFWADGSAIGRRVKRGPISFPLAWSEIVGVVENVRGSGLGNPFEPEIYMVDAQYQGFFFPRDLVVKTVRPLPALVAPVKEAVWALDRNIPIARISPMHSVVAATLLPSRFRTMLVIAFAGLALVVAAIGIYGVIAYDVTRRSREIGLRIALGAEPVTVARDVMIGCIWLVVPGLVLGSAASLIAARLLSAMLLGVGPTDPATYAAAATVMLVIALAASWVPSRRAARVDPVRVLLTE
jgi:putative ABC transport system permease protein